MEAAAGLYAGIIFPDTAARADLHLSHLQKAMLDATPDCIKLVSVDGTLLTMNRAGCLALNVPRESGFGMPWLPLLPEDVHAAGSAALLKAAAGKTARFPGKSLSPDGTVYWDNLLTPLTDAEGRVLSILCVSRDVTQKTLLEMQLEEAVEREKLLAREMRHRIKNLFSLVSGLIFIAEKEADDAEDATEILRDKLAALSRASDAVFAEGGGGAAVDIASVIPSVLRPYGHRCAIAGPAVSIRRDAVTMFALFLHELSTNAVKYGALGGNGGTVTVHWTVHADALSLTWTETGGPHVSTPPERGGFGTEMVDRVVRSARGTIHRTWRPEGLVVDLHFPKMVGA